MARCCSSKLAPAPYNLFAEEAEALEALRPKLMLVPALIRSPSLWPICATVRCC